MPEYSIRFVGCTDKGRRRKNNEDYFFIPSEEYSDLELAIVADGMGGYNAGEYASQMGVEISRNLIAGSREQEMTAEELVVYSIQSANAAVYEYACTHDFCEGMGTTMVMALWNGASWIVGNVGDSRAYMFRSRQLTQITVDNSMVQELVNAGMITPEEAKTHPNRNIITRAVGTDPEVEIDLYRVDHVLPGDTLLLCSDGLTEHVEIDKIIEILSGVRPLKSKANELIREANRMGGTDNITVVLASCVERRKFHGA